MTDTAIVPTSTTSLARNPAAVYLARLAPGSRRTMRRALATVAGLLSSDQQTDTLTFPWADLRYQHTAAVRSALAARVAVATANKHLAALRGVLYECGRLELMTAEDCRRAIEVPGIKAVALPLRRADLPGRALRIPASELQRMAGGNTEGEPKPASDA